MIWLLWNVKQYDIVITSTPPISTGAPGLLAATLRKPWIVDVRDLWIDASISLGYLAEGGLIERISRWFQQQVLSTSDRIAVTTNSLGDSLQETYGQSLGEKIILIPNGVDVERFQPSPDQKSGMNKVEDTSGRNKSAYADGARPGQSTNAAVKADDATPTIIYTGNLGSAQDLESCIRAMNYLSHDSAVLRLVGRGDVESKLQRCADEHGLENRVEFDGMVPRTEIPALLEEATIGIAPLRDTEELSYAMPTKVYEYMATGLPTVATGQGEIEQFMNESGGGVHVENNPEEIATTFDKLLADKQRRRQLGSNGREYIQEMYDRKSIAHQLGTELTSLLEEKT